MDLTLTAEQRLLVESARAFLERVSPPEHVRAMEKDGRGFDATIWRQMAALGWQGIAIPQEHGGSGQAFLETVLLLEQMGRVLLPSPYLVGCAVAAPLLLAAPEEQRQRWFPLLAAGNAVLSVGLLEPGNGEESALAAESDGGNVRLSGRKRFVPFAPDADLLLVLANVDGSGMSLVAIERGTEGVSFRKLTTLGGDPMYEVHFDNVRVLPAALLAAPGVARPASEQAFLHAATASLAYALGAAERALEMSVEYAKTRVQFGRPIGSFQAVAHRLVDMRSDIDALRYLIYQAAWSLAAGRPSDLEVGAAKAWGNEALGRIFMHAHQVHGAIGFSMEHDLQLFTRRAKATELLWGSTAAHRERVARAMGL
jgi:alkylation response protein AidB-like acyl-CoA dehydrogenase